MLNNPIVQGGKKKSKKITPYINPHEVWSETKTQAKGVVNEVIHELFALPKKGDLQPGEELNFKTQDKQNAQEESKRKSLENHANQIRPAIDYIGEILKTGETKEEDKQK